VNPPLFSSCLTRPRYFNLHVTATSYDAAHSKQFLQFWFFESAVIITCSHRRRANSGAATPNGSSIPASSLRVASTYSSNGSYVTRGGQSRISYVNTSGPKLRVFEKSFSLQFSLKELSGTCLLLFLAPLEVRSLHILRLEAANRVSEAPRGMSVISQNSFSTAGFLFCPGLARRGKTGLDPRRGQLHQPTHNQGPMEGLQIDYRAAPPFPYPSFLPAAVQFFLPRIRNKGSGAGFSTSTVLDAFFSPAFSVSCYRSGADS
jgi:hypothetical protein